MPEKLKNGWTRVAFGDVVQLCRERTSDPAEDGFDRYIGLEHLEPGDLKIRRWGNVEDGTTFTNVFRAGQVLFGKRRAYQRKVAVAEFDGVCSGDIYVLTPKNEHLLTELLPFICMTDGFFEHAVGTSAGSLSPRTNWESLASYAFALPPLEEQRRIAEALQTAWDASEGYSQVMAMGPEVRRALINDFLCLPVSMPKTTSIFDSKWPIMPLGDLCEISSGVKNSEEAHIEGTFPFFTCGPEPLRSNTFSFDCEAILLPGNNASGIYKPQHYKGKFEVRQRVYVLRLSKESPISYGYLFIALERGLTYLRSRSVGTQAKFITISDLRSVPIPIPPANIQSQIVSITTSIENIVTTAEKRQSQIRNLLAYFMSEGLRGDNLI